MGKVKRVPQFLVYLDSGNTSFRCWFCSCVGWKQSNRGATVLWCLEIPSRSVGAQLVWEPSTSFCFLAKLYCTRHRWLLNPGEKKGGKRLPLHSVQAWISRALIKGEAAAIIIVPRNFSHWSGEFPTEPNLIGLFTAFIEYLCPFHILFPTYGVWRIL